jgi:hypothetical protein
MEFYDTLFEQVYHDVQFQLNVIKPHSSNSRQTSPNARQVNKIRLNAIQEETRQDILAETADEVNEKSATNTMGNDDGHEDDEQIRSFLNNGMSKALSKDLQLLSSQNTLQEGNASKRHG